MMRSAGSITMPAFFVREAMRAAEVESLEAVSTITFVWNDEGQAVLVRPKR